MATDNLSDLSHVNPLKQFLQNVGVGLCAKTDLMSVPKECVIDKTANDWPLWIDHPTTWVKWLNAIAADYPPLASNDLESLPLAGIAGDNWHFATLAKKGEVVGLIELSIESNKKSAFYALMDHLNWQSLEVLSGTGLLAGRCLLASLASTSSSDFLIEAGLEMIYRGAIPPWRDLSQHVISCSVSDRLLIEKDDLLRKLEIPCEENHRLPLPIALIIDSKISANRHDVFRIWARQDVDSLCLSHFVEGVASGGGVLHACVWSGEDALLSFMLKRESGALVAAVDDKGRTPLQLAIDLGSDSCENALRTYNGRRISNEILRHI